MKKHVTNIEFLRSVFVDASAELKKHGSLNVTYDAVEKPKTMSQLGFIFGGIVTSMNRFFEEAEGEKRETAWIKHALYQKCAPKKVAQDLNGDPFVYMKTLSDMSAKEASQFIEDVIQFIDTDLPSCVLTPDIRNTWTRHISKADIKQHLQQEKFFPKDDKAYLSHIRKQACICCGVPNQSEAHHLRTTNDSGTGMKAPDYTTIPLCRECHAKLHNSGEQTFYRNISKGLSDIPIESFCMIQYNKYRLKN